MANVSVPSEAEWLWCLTECLTSVCTIQFCQFCFKVCLYRQPWSLWGRVCDTAHWEGASASSACCFLVRVYSHCALGAAERCGCTQREIPGSLVVVQPLTRTGQKSGRTLQCFYSLVQVSINHLKLPSGLNFPISHLEQVLPGYRKCCRKGTKTF